jgi:LAO/AO transport system kinase
MGQADNPGGQPGIDPGIGPGILAGDRAALARGLNLLDDRRPASRAGAGVLLESLDALSIDRHRLIGITGPPGVGKSSLTSALIRVWRGRGLTVGVLAVDPSSPISGGALLGDRLRMKTSAGDEGVFVRSLSSRGEFGGLSAEVWPMSLLMLAAFDVVLVETVGVGQREVDVARTCDTTCFVAQPGSGDSIQFLKAGVLEVPHVLVVNKLDMGEVASRTLSELTGAVNREHPDGDWTVPILSTSATEGLGIDALADALEAHHAMLRDNGRLLPRRRTHQANWTIKRLEEEFGRSGISRLGGDQALLDRLLQSTENPFTQFEHCRLALQPESGHSRP